ncbi:MAG: methylenetetrahydrofolate reductase [NAD(P)H] [Actinomycetota bacterium]|nr:methylenetetrahydrofolate reductase [NAD(P)H] [Actinomycetota bacterium]
MQTQYKYPKVFSVELFPPKTPAGEENLAAALGPLAALEPAFFSVTFGAGGTTRSGTLETVTRTMAQTGIEAAPHLSCIEGTRESIGEFLDRYKEAGARRIVALRGDLPGDMESPGVFAYASELIGFIRERTGDYFHIEVGCYPEFHPEAVSPFADLTHFREKVEAGADSAMTQFFFNPDAYFYFVDQVERMGVNIPIVPGIMPLGGNYAQIARFAAGCGAEIPLWLRKRMEDYGDDAESQRQLGVEFVTDLCQRLLDAGAPGLHFYSLNRAEPTSTIWNNLGLTAAAA